MDEVFFLVDQELARLKVEAKQNAGVEQKPSTKHNELSNATRNKLFVPGLSLITTLQAYTNPFEYDGDDIINIATKAVVADDAKKHIETVGKFGSAELNEFIESRLKNTTASFRDPMERLSVKDIENLCERNKAENER